MVTSTTPGQPRQYPVSEADEYSFALTASDREELFAYLFPDEHAQFSIDVPESFSEMCERGVLGVITRSTGNRRVKHLLHHVVPPEPEEVRIERGGCGFGSLTFDQVYRDRATRQARELSGAGLATFHTHPFKSALPSRLDRETERERASDLFFNMGEQVPFAAVIVPEAARRDGVRHWSVGAYQPSDDSEGAERVTDATAVQIVGETFEQIPTTANTSGVEGARAGGDPIKQDSVADLWGERGQAILGALRVAVVGCGGVGSLLAEQLARLGVGELVFIDFDIVKEDNLNRAYGATEDDVRTSTRKTEVARRQAERAATAPHFNARSVVGSVVEGDATEYAALGTALDCDVWMNAADTHWARMVADRVAHAHLIPVIDGGTLLNPRETDHSGVVLDESARSTITVSGPAHTCLRHADMWEWGDKDAGVNHDRLPIRDRPDEGGEYGLPDDGTDIRNPSVVTTNGLVASLMSERLVALTLGTTSDGAVGAQEYRPTLGTVRWLETADGRVRSCDTDCSRKEMIGVGDGQSMCLGTDYDLQKEVQLGEDSSE